MNFHYEYLIVAVIAAAVAIRLWPGRRRVVALVSIVALFGLMLVMPASGSFTSNNPSTPNPSAAATYSAYSMPTPSSIGCQWIGASTTAINWGTGGNWPKTQVRRQTDSGGYADYGTAVYNSTTTYTDPSASNPTAHTYSYRVEHVMGATPWTGGQQGVSISMGSANSVMSAPNLFCRDGINQLVSGAVNSKVNAPGDVAVDSSGNVYIADTSNHEIRKITASTGVISRFAGSGTSGSTGDGAAASSAQLAGPRGVTVASNGDVFIADTNNDAVRWVPATTCSSSCTASYGQSTWTAGNIYLIAGSEGNSGSGTYDGSCTQIAAANANAKLGSVRDVAVLSNGDVLAVDQTNARVVKICKSDDHGCAYAGTGASLGDGGAATSAKLSSPEGIAVDAYDNAFIADKGNNEVRMVKSSTAGAPTYNVAASAGNIYNVAGKGDGTSGNGGNNVVANTNQLNSPWNVAVDSNGSILISDEGNKLIKLVYGGNSGNRYGASGSTQWNIYTIAGVASTTTYSGEGFPLVSAGNATSPGNAGDPYGVAFNNTGANEFYWADNAKNVIRWGDVADNVMYSVAGQGAVAGNNAGDNSVSHYWGINTVAHAVADSSGNVYFADSADNRVREWMASTGYVRTIAGLGGASESGDGSNALAANLKAPTGIALDSSNPPNVYVVDSTGGEVRKIDMSNGVGNITQVAGNGGSSCTTTCGDGASATAAGAKFDAAKDIAIDSNGSLFITDSANCQVRMVWHTNSPTYGLGTLTNGFIYRLAGSSSGTCSSTGDSASAGAAASATLLNPDGIDIDPATGSLYVAERGGYKIRKITSTGAISTFAGNQASCDGGTGDGGAATSANLCNPGDVAWDASTSSLYISDTGNTKVRCVATAANSACGRPSGSTATANNIYLVANGSGGNGGWAQNASLTTPFGLGLANTNLVIASSTANTDLRIVTGADP